MRSTPLTASELRDQAAKHGLHLHRWANANPKWPSVQWFLVSQRETYICREEPERCFRLKLKNLQTTTPADRGG